MTKTVSPVSVLHVIMIFRAKVFRICLYLYVLVCPIAYQTFFVTGEIGAVELDEDDEDCDEAEEITIEPGLIGDVDDIAEEEDEEQGIMEQSLQASLESVLFWLHSQLLGKPWSTGHVVPKIVFN